METLHYLIISAFAAVITLVLRNGVKHLRTNASSPLPPPPRRARLFDGVVFQRPTNQGKTRKGHATPNLKRRQGRLGR